MAFSLTKFAFHALYDSGKRTKYGHVLTPTASIMASIARIWDAFSSSCKNVKSHESAVSGNSLIPKIKAQLHSTPSHLVHNTLALVE